MSDSSDKSSWDSLASELGVSPTAQTPPPPPPPPAAPVQPVQGTPSRASMQSAPRTGWQDLAQTFGIRLPEPAPVKQQPVERQRPVEGQQVERQPAGASASVPFAEPLSLPAAPAMPASDAPVMLSPLAADTYKFEVIEETEIEFSTYRETEADPAEPFAWRGDEAAEKSEDGQRRRRRRRRRRGGRADRPASAADPAARRSDEGRLDNRLEDEEPRRPETPDAAVRNIADLDDDELDAIEEAARREDLGLPPLDRRPSERRPADQRRGGRRRGRRGRYGERERGRADTPREPLPDGVAHGDEYDILDDVVDDPSTAERPYGGHALQADGGGAMDEAHDQGDVEGEGQLESLHRNIHTWEQTVGTLIAKNMESRARFPGTSQPRGGRGRGGRHRGRGRGRGGAREG